jgi:HicA toxin of bacterial toxin-antitoxin,
MVYKHPDGRKVTIPHHAGEEIGPGLLNKIIKKDLAITRQEFLKALIASQVNNSDCINSLFSCFHLTSSERSQSTHFSFHPLSERNDSRAKIS